MKLKFFFLGCSIFFFDQLDGIFRNFEKSFFWKFISGCSLPLS
uniref:Uncharacterized protein n=1 Tax=viral metagenome TaxID=1070528 RepID=A0A6C0BMZ1_9ZZZZ